AADWRAHTGGGGRRGDAGPGAERAGPPAPRLQGAAHDRHRFAAVRGVLVRAGPRPVRPRRFLEGPVTAGAAELTAILQRDPVLAQALPILAALDLPDAWIGAGAVRNPVFDHLHELKPAPLADIDV